MDTLLTSERDTIKSGIAAWITAVEGRDIGLLPKVAAQDADSVWIGAGAGDWLVGFDALEQAMRAQNAALQDIHIQVSDETVHVSPSGDMVWATNQWVFNAQMGDHQMALPLRCTWILEKRDGQWIIVHFHKSAGLPG
jgi:ketosteroid isomerase-like protein